MTNIFSLLTLDFARVDWQASYLSVSLIVACLVIYENVMFYQSKGKIPDDALAQWVSFFDIIWLVVSGVVLYYVNLYPLAKIVPVLFIIYNIFGWIYSIYLLKDEDIDVLDDLDNIIIPKSYIDYCMSFGIVCSCAIVAVFYTLFQKKLLALSFVL